MGLRIWPTNAEYEAREQAEREEIERQGAEREQVQREQAEREAARQAAEVEAAQDVEATIDEVLATQETQYEEPRMSGPIIQALRQLIDQGDIEGAIALLRHERLLALLRAVWTAVQPREEPTRADLEALLDRHTIRRQPPR